jgi:hypothetical protein
MILMKASRNIVLPGIVVVFLAFSAADALSEGQELAIKLVPERKVYMLGEKIYFGLFIENVSDHSAMIPTTWSIEPREGYLVSVEIEGYPHLINPFYDSGDELPSSLVLDAGAVYHEYFSLGEWNFSGFNQPGKYKIRAIYQVRAEKTGKYWRGKVMSNWVEFEIAAPKTDADKAAYAILTDNGKMTIEDALRWYSNKKVPAETLEKVMNEYPNSVYGRIACESLVERYVYCLVDMPTLRKYWEFAQQHWPEDILLSVIDASIAQRMAERDNKKEATEVIDRLLEKPQNARVLRMLRRAVRGHDLIVGNPKALGLFQDGWKPPTKQEKPKPVETKPAAETAVPAAPGLVLHSTSGFPWYNYALIALAIICASAAAYFIISKRKKREAAR